MSSHSYSSFAIFSITILYSRSNRWHKYCELVLFLLFWTSSSILCNWSLSWFFFLSDNCFSLILCKSYKATEIGHCLCIDTTGSYSIDTSAGVITVAFSFRFDKRSKTASCSLPSSILLEASHAFGIVIACSACSAIFSCCFCCFWTRNRF